jgi:transcriptional regulator with XRE-family HTH domain
MKSEDEQLTADMMRAGRALLGWEQKDIAERTGLALGSVKRLEAVRGPVILGAQNRTIAAIKKAFAEAGVTFKREVDIEARTATFTVSHKFKFKFEEDLKQDELAAQERSVDEIRAILADGQKKKAREPG